MTKDFAIPGLRLGCAVACSELMSKLRYYRVPWSVNAIAIEAAKYLLADGDISWDIDGLLNEAARVASALTDMGIDVEPSDTNFMLCRLPKGCASDLKAYLVDNYSILIRDASNFEGLTKRHFRIAVQTPDQNDALINAIWGWMLS